MESGLYENSSLDGRIAARVRGLRAAQGLTLDALAERSGVSRSMISRVERGESSATAVLLDRIAAGLGTSIARLFDEPDPAPSPVLRRAQQLTWRDPQSGYLRRNLSPAGVGSPLQLSEVSFPAGARVAYEVGLRSIVLDQQIWVIAGVIEIGIGDARQRLEVGDCMAMRLDTPIVFRNPTRKAARYLVAVSGSGPGG